jgi:hypothetical protein
MRQNMLCIVILIRVLKNFSFFLWGGVWGRTAPTAPLVPHCGWANECHRVWNALDEAQPYE